MMDRLAAGAMAGPHVNANRLRARLGEDSGQGTVEYAGLAMAIGVLLIAVGSYLGGKDHGIGSVITSAIQGAVEGAVWGGGGGRGQVGPAGEPALGWRRLHAPPPPPFIFASPMRAAGGTLSTVDASGPPPPGPEEVRLRERLESNDP